LPRYELSINTDFDLIFERCVAAHGNGWLTEPLFDVIKKIRQDKNNKIKPFSFGVYRNGKLAAGEFGIVAGKVYTSYSGYHDEKSAGKVQMILTAHYLRDNNFAFWDLGMPLQYKLDLGATLVDTESFLKIFREAANI
jgi:Leu/Phe-tRNA-protein transferase